MQGGGAKHKPPLYAAGLTAFPKKGAQQLPRRSHTECSAAWMGVFVQQARIGTTASCNEAQQTCFLFAGDKGG